jgi:hypothetical protein
MVLNEAPDLGGDFSAIPAHDEDLPNGTAGPVSMSCFTSIRLSKMVRDSEPKVERRLSTVPHRPSEGLREWVRTGRDPAMMDPGHYCLYGP